MNTYLVGALFPDNRYLSKEGAVIRFNEQFFDVILVMRGVVKDEIDKIKSGKITYGLFERKNIPFLVLDFGGFDLDASFNIFKLSKEEAEKWMVSDGNLCNIFLIEKSGGLLKAMRTISLDSKLVAQLKATLAGQLQNYASLGEVDKEILHTEISYTTRSMFNRIEQFKIA